MASLGSEVRRSSHVVDARRVWSEKVKPAPQRERGICEDAASSTSIAKLVKGARDDTRDEDDDEDDGHDGSLVELPRSTERRVSSDLRLALLLSLAIVANLHPRGYGKFLTSTFPDKFLSRGIVLFICICIYIAHVCTIARRSAHESVSDQRDQLNYVAPFVFTESTVHACVRACVSTNVKPAARILSRSRDSEVTDTWCVDDRATRGYRIRPLNGDIGDSQDVCERIARLSFIFIRWQIPTPRHNRPRYVNTHFFRAGGGKRQMASPFRRGWFARRVATFWTTASTNTFTNKDRPFRRLFLCLMYS